MTSTTRLGALRFDILLLAAVAAASLGLPAGARGALAPPAGLAVTDAGSGNVRLVWSRSGPNAAQVTGYRVYRDGRFYKRVRGLSMRVRASRLHTYRVAASDTDGRPGAKSGVVKVIRRHRPPGRPGRLKRRVTDSEVRLSWSRSPRRSGKIAGYRIYRDRVLVRQVRGRRARDRDLAAGTRYRFTVAAIDTHGYMGPAARASASTADPSPTEGSTHAFLLASTGESFRDLQRHYRQVGTVYPTYFECEKTRGAIVGDDDPLVTRWAQLRRIRVLPRFDCQKPAALHLILTDPAVRAATIAGIVALVRRHGYDGINADFENGPATDRDALTSFVSDLAAALHAIGKDLSVEVSAKFQHTTTGRSGLYDYEALGAAADHVFVMNWGWHWSTSAPGAPDDWEKCRQVADYVASMPNKERFVLATHMYGMDWPAGGGPAHTAAALEYADVQALIAQHGATPVLDPLSDAWTFSYTDGAGVPHEVWYPDAATIARRVTLARERGLGIGFWRLGEEDQRVWDDPQIAPGTAWP
jgi:spore germination protein YaaH